MNAFKTATHAFFALTCIVVLQTKSFAEPINLNDLKTEIKAYHDSGLYTKEMEHAIAPATAYIIQRAQANAKNTQPQKLAIVLDIDETSLSNYKNLVARDFGFSVKAFAREIMVSDAPAIAPVLSFYQTALKHNIAVFFVTGRPQTAQLATQKNLKAAGFREWKGLYLRPDTYKQPSNIPFKIQARKAITEQGYTIIASVGDQASDLTGGYAEKMYKLPNPYYFVP